MSLSPPPPPPQQRKRGRPKKPPPPPPKTTENEEDEAAPTTAPPPPAIEMEKAAKASSKFNNRKKLTDAARKTLTSLLEEVWDVDKVQTIGLDRTTAAQVLDRLFTEHEDARERVTTAVITKAWRDLRRSRTAVPLTTRAAAARGGPPTVTLASGRPKKMKRKANEMTKADRAAVAEIENDKARKAAKRDATEKWRSAVQAARMIDDPLTNEEKRVYHEAFVAAERVAKKNNWQGEAAEDALELARTVPGEVWANQAIVSAAMRSATRPQEVPADEPSTQELCTQEVQMERARLRRQINDRVEKGRSIVEEIGNACGQLNKINYGRGEPMEHHAAAFIFAQDKEAMKKKKKKKGKETDVKVSNDIVLADALDVNADFT